jgi:hypothetical protein
MDVREPVLPETGDRAHYITSYGTLRETSIGKKAQDASLFVFSMLFFDYLSDSVG